MYRRATLTMVFSHPHETILAARQSAAETLRTETRRNLIELARREHALVLSYHVPLPGVGHIGAAGWEAG